MASWAPADATPDPKPPERVKAAIAEQKAIRAYFKDQCCVGCGIATDEPPHHIVFRSEGGGDVIENLCQLCRTCHTRFHSRSSGWEQVAAKIRKYVTDARTPAGVARRDYVLGQMGHRFNRRYPPLENRDDQFWLDFRGIRKFREPEVEL